VKMCNLGHREDVATNIMMEYVPPGVDNLASRALPSCQLADCQHLRQIAMAWADCTGCQDAFQRPTSLQAV